MLSNKKSSRIAKILPQFSTYSGNKPLLDLIEIQRKSFFDLLEYGIAHELGQIATFRETAKDSVSTRELELVFNPETYKLVSPNCTPKQAILKGKTYACKLYVQATLTIRSEPHGLAKQPLRGNGRGTDSNPLLSNVQNKESSDTFAKRKEKKFVDKTRSSRLSSKEAAEGVQTNPTTFFDFRRLTQNGTGVTGKSPSDFLISSHYKHFKKKRNQGLFQLLKDSECFFPLTSTYLERILLRKPFTPKGYWVRLTQKGNTSPEGIFNEYPIPLRGNSVRNKVKNNWCTLLKENVPKDPRSFSDQLLESLYLKNLSDIKIRKLLTPSLLYPYTPLRFQVRQRKVGNKSTNVGDLWSPSNLKSKYFQFFTNLGKEKNSPENAFILASLEKEIFEKVKEDRLNVALSQDISLKTYTLGQTFGFAKQKKETKLLRRDQNHSLNSVQTLSLKGVKGKTKPIKLADTKSATNLIPPRGNDKLGFFFTSNSQILPYPTVFLNSFQLAQQGPRKRNTNKLNIRVDLNFLKNALSGSIPLRYADLKSLGQFFRPQKGLSMLDTPNLITSRGSGVMGCFARKRSIYPLPLRGTNLRLYPATSFSPRDRERVGGILLDPEGVRLGALQPKRYLRSNLQGFRQVDSRSLLPKRAKYMLGKPKRLRSNVPVTPKRLKGIEQPLVAPFTRPLSYFFLERPSTLKGYKSSWAISEAEKLAPQLDRPLVYNSSESDANKLTQREDGLETLRLGASSHVKGYLWCDEETTRRGLKNFLSQYRTFSFYNWAKKTNSFFEKKEFSFPFVIPIYMTPEGLSVTRHNALASPLEKKSPRLFDLTLTNHESKKLQHKTFLKTSSGSITPNKLCLLAVKNQESSDKVYQESLDKVYQEPLQYKISKRETKIGIRTLARLAKKINKKESLDLLSFFNEINSTRNYWEYPWRKVLQFDTNLRQDLISKNLNFFLRFFFVPVIPKGLRGKEQPQYASFDFLPLNPLGVTGIDHPINPSCPRGVHASQNLSALHSGLQSRIPLTSLSKYSKSTSLLFRRRKGYEKVVFDTFWAKPSTLKKHTSSWMQPKVALYPEGVQNAIRLIFYPDKAKAEIKRRSDGVQPQVAPNIPSAVFSDALHFRKPFTPKGYCVRLDKGATEILASSSYKVVSEAEKQQLRQIQPLEGDDINTVVKSFWSPAKLTQKRNYISKVKSVTLFSPTKSVYDLHLNSHTSFVLPQKIRSSQFPIPVTLQALYPEKLVDVRYPFASHGMQPKVTQNAPFLPPRYRHQSKNAKHQPGATNGLTSLGYRAKEVEKKENIQIFNPWIFLGELPVMTRRGHFILNGSPRVIVNQIARCPGIYFQEKRRGVGFEQEVRVSADIIPQRGPWLRIQSDWEGRFWARLKQEGRVKYATLYGAFQEFEKQYSAPLVSSIITSSTDFPKSEMLAFQEKKAKEDRQKKALVRLFKNSTRYGLGELGRFRINERVHSVSLLQTTKLPSPSFLPFDASQPEGVGANLTEQPQYASFDFVDHPEVEQPEVARHLESSEPKKGEKSRLPLTRSGSGVEKSFTPSFLPSKVQGVMGSDNSAKDAFTLQNKQLVPALPSKKISRKTALFDSVLPQRGSFFFLAKQPEGVKKSTSTLTKPFGTTGYHISSQLKMPSSAWPLRVKGYEISDWEKNIMVDKSFSSDLSTRLKPKSPMTFAPQGVQPMVYTPTYPEGVYAWQDKVQGTTEGLYPFRLNCRGLGISTDSLSFNVGINDPSRTRGSTAGQEMEKYLLMAKDIDAVHTFLERLLEGQGSTDDIDHLKNRFIRTSGKLLQQQFELGLNRLNEVITPLLKNLIQGTALSSSSTLGNMHLSKDISVVSKKKKPKKLSEKVLSNNQSLHPELEQPKVAQVQGKREAAQKGISNDPEGARLGASFDGSRLPSYKAVTSPFRWLRTSKPINGAFREFFGSNPLSQYMDQSNPLAEITHKRRLSSMGPGGIKRETAGMEVRGIHPTHYGRICPIETPEGKNAGLVNSPTVYGRVGKKGFMETPLYQVVQSQIQTKRWSFFSAQQEEGEETSLATCDVGLTQFNLLPYVPISVQTANNPLAHFQQVERNRVGFRALSPVQTISIATALIPFLEHDDANRALMGSNMQRQAIPLLLPERPIVGTGFEPIVITESGQALQATTTGYVSHVSANKIVLHSIGSVGKTLPQSFLRNYENRVYLAKRAKPVASFLPGSLASPTTALQNKPSVAPASFSNLTPSGSSEIPQGLPLRGVTTKGLYPFGVKGKKRAVDNPEEIRGFSFNSASLEWPSTPSVASQDKVQGAYTQYPFGVKGCSFTPEGYQEDCSVRLDKGATKVLTPSKYTVKLERYKKHISIISLLETECVGIVVNQVITKRIGKYLIHPLVKVIAPSEAHGVRVIPKVAYLKNCAASILPEQPTVVPSLTQHPFGVKGLQSKSKLKEAKENRLDALQPIGLAASQALRGKELQGANKGLSSRLSSKEAGTTKDLYPARVLEQSLIHKIKKHIPLRGKPRNQRKLNLATLYPRGPVLPLRDIGARGAAISCLGQINHKISQQATDPSVVLRSHLCSTHNAFFLKAVEQPLQLYQRSNQETCLSQRPLVQQGDWVQKGDFIADCSASHFGDLALGKNVTVAYMPWEGYNFEDAIVISDRLVADDVYTSIHIERYEIKVSKNSQGKEKITNQIPSLPSRSLNHLDNLGIARVSSWVQPGDILVGKVVELKRPLSPYERLAWELASRLSPTSPEREKWLNKVWLEDISLRLPPGVCGRVINSQIVSTEWSEKEQVAYPLEVHIYLAVKRKIQVGDKLAGRHGNKGIVSTILPRQDMPYLGDGSSIDMILNPLGVPSRMNLGQIFECLLGLAGSQLGCNFKVTPFDEIAGGEASRSLVFLKLYQCRLLYKQQWLFTPTFPGKCKLFDGRTGEPFENWVTVGRAYMLKLIHMVDHKIHARSTGPYSLFTRQPVRGRSRRGGQRLGEMEVWAVEGFGAAYTLQEFLTIKSDDLKARAALQRSFYKQSDVTLRKVRISPGNPEAFKVLVSELQALCLHIHM